MRERDTEREREKDGSDVTIVALKLAMSFALLLAKNVHLSIDEEFCAIPCQKICTSVSRLMMALTPKRLFLSFSLSSCLPLFSAFFLALTIGSINIF